MIEINNEVKNIKKKTVNVVLQGGGVKGVALIGGLQIIEPHININHCVGTSAGAVTASLIAAGYSAEEVLEILREENLADIVGIGLDSLLRIPITLLRTGALLKAENLAQWVDQKLRKKLGLDHACRFVDLPIPLTIIATDLGSSSVIKFSKQETPQSIVGWAVRYSSTIPYLFSVSEREGSELVDGGIVWNFAIKYFDEDPNQPPTIGLALKGPPPEHRSKRFIVNLIDAITKRGGVQVTSSDKSRVISIPTYPIGVADFNASKYELDFLYENGKEAAQEYLNREGERFGLIHQQVTLDNRTTCLEEAKKIWLKRKRKALSTIILLGILLIGTFWSLGYLIDNGGERYKVSTFAGTGVKGNDNAHRKAATFEGPSGVSVNGDGELFIADTYNNAIRMIGTDGVLQTLKAGVFSDPFDVVATNDGRVFVADLYNHAIHVLEQTKLGQWQLDLVAGNSGEEGDADGNAKAARFSAPMGLSLYENEALLFVADSGNSSIRWIDLKEGWVGTVISKTKLDYPQDIEFHIYDGRKFLYIADTFHHKIIRGELSISKDRKRIDMGGEVILASGGAKLYGNTRNIYELIKRTIKVSGSLVEFLLPYHIALDNSDNLLVSDYGNGIVWKITTPYLSEQKVHHVAGKPGVRGEKGFRDDMGSRARFSRPIGLTTDADGAIYVADDYNNRIRRIDQLNLGLPLSIFNVFSGFLFFLVCRLVFRSQKYQTVRSKTSGIGRRMAYFGGIFLVVLGIIASQVFITSGQLLFWLCLLAPLVVVMISYVGIRSASYRKQELV